MGRETPPPGPGHRAAVVQHVPWEGPGALGAWLRRRGFRITEVPVYRGAALPKPDAFDWLVSLGGPMGADEEAAHPWLAAEKRTMEAAVARGCTVVGVCLGAQILARVLGARVGPAPAREIGWHPVRRVAAPGESPLAAALPERFDAFHWHADAFERPRGAVHLLESAPCPEQGFVLDGRLLGLQCHLETTPALVRALVRSCPGDLAPGPWVQPAGAMLERPGVFSRANAILARLLDALADAAARPAAR